MEGTITQLSLSNYLLNDKIPKISYFKHSYFNYSNFAFDTRKIPLQATAKFGNTTSWRLDQNNYGDLITNIILEINLPDISSILTNTGSSIGYANGIGNILIQNIDLRINNELIDSQNSIFRDIWSSLTIPPGNQINYKNMIKKFDSFNSSSFTGGKIYVPLLHWFCQYTNQKDRSLVFPIAAFYNQTIEMFITFAPFLNCIVSNDNSIPSSYSVNIENAQLLVDFVTLEEKERLQLQQPSLLNSFMILQTNYLNFSFSAGTTNSTISLKQIKYLVSEILIVAQRNDVGSPPLNDYFNYSTQTGLTNRKTPIKKLTLKFDGKDKFTDIPSQYFYSVVPLKSHSNVPINNFIHCISFSLLPEKLEQPSGLCNFSEIQDPLLLLEFESGLPAFNIYIYYINYNMLENKDGCASLLHSMSKSVPTSIDRIKNIIRS
jgi:hypothetical protein